MKMRRLFVVMTVLAALPLSYNTRRKPAPGSSASEAKIYAVSKAYTTLSFTAKKWMVFKEDYFRISAAR